MDQKMKNQYTYVPFNDEDENSKDFLSETQGYNNSSKAKKGSAKKTKKRGGRKRSNAKNPEE